MTEIVAASHLPLSEGTRQPSQYIASTPPLPPPREPASFSSFGSETLKRSDIAKSTDINDMYIKNGAKDDPPSSQSRSGLPARLRMKHFRFLGLRWRFLKPETAREVIPPPASVTARRMRPRRHLGRYIVSENNGHMLPEVIALEAKIKNDAEQSVPNSEVIEYEFHGRFHSESCAIYDGDRLNADLGVEADWSDYGSSVRGAEPVEIVGNDLKDLADEIRHRNAAIFFRKGLMTSADPVEPMLAKPSPRAAAGATRAGLSLSPRSPMVPNSPRPSKSLERSGTFITKRDIMQQYYKSVAAKKNVDPSDRRSKLIETRLNKLEISRTFKEFLVDKGHRVPKFMSGVKIDAPEVVKSFDTLQELDDSSLQGHSVHSMRPSASILSTTGMSVRSGSSRRSSSPVFR